MKRSDTFALMVVLVVLVGFPAGLFGYQAWRGVKAGVKIVEITARAPEQGGFSPDRLTLQAGEPVRLRLSSPDVVHGFSIPGLGVNIDEILPGRVVEVDVTPVTPGRYAFACTRWCGPDHWRMRGVIEVTDASGAALPTEAPPLFQQLGVDLDAPRQAATVPPAGQPSVSRGARLNVAPAFEPARAGQRRAVSPAAAFRRLRDDAAYSEVSDGDIWNLVAWAWIKDSRPEALARAETRYARDCAACHGADGRGGGPAGVNLPGMAKMDPSMPKGPANFTDPARMLAASDVLLQGKLLRGGMGTGMPEFGSLYSDEELWAMITYLRTFIFTQ